MSIEWQEGAVCFADGEQWLPFNDNLIDGKNNKIATTGYIVGMADLLLNTIKQGDYIPKSELDTEDKYNRAVEVFGLLGFEFNSSAIKEFRYFTGYDFLGCCDDGLWQLGSGEKHKERKLTFNQLIAIGELKRLVNERESNHSAKPNSSASKVNRDIDAFKDGNKYHREIIGLDGTKTTVDVYRVLDAFKTGCPATDHAIKKMLCAGLRGHKDKITDYDNAIESLEQAKALLIQKESK